MGRPWRHGCIILGAVGGGLDCGGPLGGEQQPGGRTLHPGHWGRGGNLSHQLGNWWTWGCRRSGGFGLGPLE